jgi:hypothetical protein
MSYKPRYDKGNWIADCDVCGRKYKASSLRKRWDGLMCCDDDWEIRQPQDFVRGVLDTQIAPWLRPEPADAFTAVCYSNSAVAGVAQATCSLTGTYFVPEQVPPSSFNTTDTIGKPAP